MVARPEAVTSQLNLGDASNFDRNTDAGSARRVLSNFAARDLSGPTESSTLIDKSQSQYSSATASLSDKFDVTKSPRELSRAGVFTDRTQANNDQVLEVPNIGDSATPKISVSMQNLQQSPPEKPNFVIRKDGRIEMYGDPEALNAKEIKVQLERQEGQLQPTVEQQQAADKLVEYLSQRIKDKNPSSPNVELNDTDNVVSPEAKQQPNIRPPASQGDMSPETQRSVGNMNRFRGNNGGEMPMSNTNEYFPPRDVPRGANESDQQAAIKEAAAGLFNPDKQAPYETVRRAPNGDHRVGRYGFNHRQINNWLESLLGDPPDPSKIEQLIKEGKLPKGFNAESLKKLQALSKKMEAGETPTKDDMKGLPNTLQESMATDMVSQYKAVLQDNPGAIAAAFASGKPASELTQEDISSPQGKQLTEAGQRLYDIASTRQQSQDTNDVLQWDQNGKVSIGNGKWLDGAAGNAFKRAQDLARADGVDIVVNSAGRTRGEQQDLYNRRGTPGVSRVVALPGTSKHEKGNALDIQNWQQAKKYLLAAGFQHGDGRGPISGDLVHFSYAQRSYA